jgi:hypothetical protein
LWLIYKPAAFGDTPAYIDLAEQLRNLDFSGYNGSRPPGYSLLLLLANLDFNVVWGIQSILGVTTSYMLYALAYYHTDSERLAFSAGLSYSLSINQLFFEAAILSETLGTFLLLLSVVLFVNNRTAKHSQTPSLAALAGVISLASLTRPILFLTIPIYAVFLFLRWRKEKISKLQWMGRVVAFFGPVIFLILGWSIFNQVQVDYFGLSTVTGYNLIEHGGGFMELASEDQATIRDVYLRYRPERLSQTGTHMWTIWDALGELQRVTGLDFSGLSKVLTKTALSLFSKHPFLYLRSVSLSWIRFWASAMLWDLSSFSLVGQQAIQWIWWTVRWLLIFSNLTFLIIVLYSLTKIGKEKQLIDYDREFHWSVSSLIVMTSMAQAFLVFGDNWRFSIPYQPLIVYVVLLWMWSFVQSRRQKVSLEEEPDSGNDQAALSPGRNEEEIQGDAIEVAG